MRVAVARPRRAPSAATRRQRALPRIFRPARVGERVHERPRARGHAAATCDALPPCGPCQKPNPALACRKHPDRNGSLLGAGRLGRVRLRPRAPRAPGIGRGERTFWQNGFAHHTSIMREMSRSRDVACRWITCTSSTMLTRHRSVSARRRSSFPQGERSS